jgi:xylulokinase
MTLTGEAAAEVCVRPPILDVLAPDPALTAAYAERFAAFTRLYAVLKGEFRREAQV